MPAIRSTRTDRSTRLGGCAKKCAANAFAPRSVAELYPVDAESVSGVTFAGRTVLAVADDEGM